MSIVNLEHYKKLQVEVLQLRARLDDINEKKEFWFKKKEDLKKDINELITKIKQIKAEKDKKNEELKELKKQRDKYNGEVKKLINKIKNLNEEKEKTFKKYNVKVDPTKIQEKINQLEKKVELEVNFEKEKKLMEEIKKLKKSYEESSEVLKIVTEANQIDSEIKESKKKADEFHRKILEITKDTTYEVFIELSKKITDLKKEQEDAFQKFIDYKKQYAEASHELTNRLDELGVLKTVFSKDKEVKKAQQLEKQKHTLKEKYKKVEEKIKKREKLTTEDLLILQDASDI